MSREIDAIYEDGVFRPLEPVDLPDQTKVQLDIRKAPGAAPAPPDDLSTQQSAIHDLLEWVNSQPASADPQRFSARDHDQVLYDWKK